MQHSAFLCIQLILSAPQTVRRNFLSMVLPPLIVRLCQQNHIGTAVEDQQGRQDATRLFKDLLKTADDGKYVLGGRHILIITDMQMMAILLPTLVTNLDLHSDDFRRFLLNVTVDVAESSPTPFKAVLSQLNPDLRDKLTFALNKHMQGNSEQKNTHTPTIALKTDFAIDY